MTRLADNGATDATPPLVTATLDGVEVHLYRAGADHHLSVQIDTTDADLPEDPTVGPLGLLVALNDGHLYDTTADEDTAPS